MSELEHISTVMRRTLQKLFAEPNYRYLIIRPGGGIELLQNYEKGAVPVRHLSEQEREAASMLD